MSALPVGLAGCQHLSHPFEETHADPGAPILTVRDSVGIAVAPVAGAPVATGQVLAEAMAAALRDAEVPATTGPGNKHSYRLSAAASVDTAAGIDRVTIRWSLGSFDGKEVGHAEQTAALSAGDWDSAGPGLQALAKAEAPEVAALVTDAAPAEHLPMQQVFVKEVAGAPGDGGRALPSALVFLLKRRGIPVVTDTAKPGTITVAGEVAVTPAAGGQDRVQIAWHILKPDGTDVGQIAQDNTVPHGTLDGKWGEVAMAVAMAGIDDILRVASTIPPA